MSRVEEELPVGPYFEDILPKTGWGPYYKFMVAMACASNFMNAATFLSLAFCIPLSSCEHIITEKIVLGIEFSFIIGRAVGGLILNCMADLYGRKRFMSYSLMVIFLSGFTSAFAYSYYVIMFSAFIVAFGLELNTAMVKIHLAEILPKKHRGFYLGLCDIFWALGFISLAVFAIFMKTQTVIETRALDMRLTTWRMIFALCGGFSILLACTTALLEESPRFFLHVKKYYLALLTLKQFYAINKSSYGETFEVKEPDLKDIIHDYGLCIYPEPHGCTNVFQEIVVLMIRSVMLLFSRRFIINTLLLILIKTPLTIMGPLNVNIWLAKHLDANSTVRGGVDFVYLDSLRDRSMCSSFDENKILYYIYFILATSFLFGKVMVMCSVDHLGRKISSVIGLVTCSSCIFGYHYLQYFSTKIGLSLTLMIFYSSVNTVVTIINIESYPTALRGTAWGIISFPGILLSLFLVKYYYLIVEYFLLSLGILYVCAAVAAYFVDDLKRKPMIE